MKKILNLSLIFITFSCATKQVDFYRAELEIQGQKLPFFVELKKDSAFLINGTERLAMDGVYQRKDSTVVELFSFGAELVFKNIGSELSGWWRKLDAADYRIPFRAVKNQKSRFQSSSTREFSGRFEVEFTKPDGNTYPAIGVFETVNGELRGTFLTNSGDYRYLAGVVDGDWLRLSCFDGTHAYLFEAKSQGDTLLEGKFWSGKSRELSWKAKKNPAFQLADASKLTFLKDSAAEFGFSFPDLNGTEVSLKDHLGKVVVVQVLGSWCPNCMDETRFLTAFHQSNQNKGFEVIGLAFEFDSELAKGTPMLKKFCQKLSVRYPMLVCGKPDQASEILSAFNKISSFPTTIMVDKKGKVNYIHTGFSGPATGKHYDEFVEDFSLRVEKLLTQ